MAQTRSRREFFRDLGIGAARCRFLLNLPSLGFANQTARKQRLIVMFSPDGVVPDDVLAGRGGRELHAQGEPDAAGAVQGPDA